jgi:hypothetical protein
MNTAELLSQIRIDRAVLDEIVVALSDDVLETAAPDGGWTAKDHLSHIAAWERMLVAHLTDGSDAALAGMTPDAYADATADRVNAHVYDLHRDDLVAAVRVEFAAAHAALAQFIETMPEGRLADVYWDGDRSGRTVLAKIAGDTYLHYREHAAWISEMVEAQAI